MATKYKLDLTQDHLNAIADDPEMDGITLEAKAEDGSKVMVTLIKSDIVKPDATQGAEEVSTEIEADEMIGNVAPEEQAAMQAAQESKGFTNESRVFSFNEFLKS